MSFRRKTEAEKRQAIKNREEALEKIIEIEDNGHHVMMYTDYHWRVDQIDVWPSVKKFMKHDGLNKVEYYEHLEDIFKEREL